MNVDRFIIDQAEWQAFGSCTFARQSNARKSIGLFLRVFRRAQDLWSSKDFAPFFLLRFEEGEISGREHFHFLVGGFPTRRRLNAKLRFFDTSGCLWWVHEWSCLNSGGWARVRPFGELKESASDYIAKGGANRYELDKFNRIHFPKCFLDYVQGKKLGVSASPREEKGMRKPKSAAQSSPCPH